MQVAEGCEDLTDDALRLLRWDVSGRLRQAVGALPRRLQMKAELVKELRIFFNILCLVCIKRKNSMHEHLLGGNPIRLCRKAVKEDALMRRMLIDDVERRRALGDDVGEVDLPDREHPLLHGDVVPLYRLRCRRYIRDAARSCVRASCTASCAVRRSTRVPATAEPHGQSAGAAGGAA